LDYELLCNKVIAITRLTGNFIRKESMNFDANAIEFKGLNDLVSYVDKNAEKQLVRNLKKLIPEAGFTTEEETINSKGEVYNWIIDPLDGTTNFIHGIPTYAISIALYEGDLPVIGVVYEINRGEMFTRIKAGLLISTIKRSGFQAERLWPIAFWRPDFLTTSLINRPNTCSSFLK
jgi:myo-inositol-1(or 4)-monophosphatase